QTAKAKFLEAWKADKTMTLSPKEFPPNIIEFFEQARKEGEREARAEAAPAVPRAPASPKPVAASPASADTSTTPSTKGETKGPLVILGVAGAGGAVAALAAGGGSSVPSTTMTPMPTPAPQGVRFVASNPPPGGTVGCSGKSDPYLTSCRLA